MDHIVPTSQRRLKCRISTTPQEMLYGQWAAPSGEEASTPAPQGSSAGIKEICPLEKMSLMHLSLCCFHTRESVEQIECSHPSPLHWTAGSGRGHEGPGLLVPGGSTPDCPKCSSSITHTNVPAGSHSELNHLQGSLRAVLSSFQLPSDKLPRYIERFGRGKRRVKNNRGSVIPLYPQSS